MFRSTRHQTKYWKDRKIDWNQAYASTWDHPHRGAITYMLRRIPHQSVWEVGVGGGANIIRIIKDLYGGKIDSSMNLMLGGSDISADAIEAVKQNIGGGVWHVESGDDLMMSDKSIDILFTDMTLIYVGPYKIRKYLREFRRVTRVAVIFVEFDSKSFWVRWKERIRGHHTHNFRKLMEKEGYYNIDVQPLGKEYFPDANNNLRHIITART